MLFQDDMQAIFHNYEYRCALKFRLVLLMHKMFEKYCQMPFSCKCVSHHACMHLLSCRQRRAAGPAQYIKNKKKILLQGSATLITFALWSLTSRGFPEVPDNYFSRCVQLNVWSSGVPGAKTVKLFIAPLLLIHVNHWLYDANSVSFKQPYFIPFSADFVYCVTNL